MNLNLIYQSPTGCCLYDYDAADYDDDDKDDNDEDDDIYISS